MNRIEEYIRNRYEGRLQDVVPDEGFLDVWEGLIQQAKSIGAAQTINTSIIPDRPVDLRDPESVRLEIYESFAGRIPIIYSGDTADFEALVTNIVHKGIRPSGIENTGASFIFGKTTRFIILSAKPYSNVPAAELGLTDEEKWCECSMILRRSHECTHYYTKQYYGVSANNLHDELMADLIGIYDAFGFYKAEWFLRFMGIIEGSGKRYGAYTSGLSDIEKDELVKPVEEAAKGLERWSETGGFRKLSNRERIDRMCAAGIEGMKEICL